MCSTDQVGSSAVPLSERCSLTVLYGGVGPEREISLLSGGAVIEALTRAGNLSVRAVELKEDSLPAGLDCSRTIVFPVLHGEFGEDGGIQELLEVSGFEFVGSDAKASRLAIDKPKSKKMVGAGEVPVVPGIDFDASNPPEAGETVDFLGGELILKPADSGSSVGLARIDGMEDLHRALGALSPGRWMLEKRIQGREFSVGVLEGKALGVVEVIPRQGIYDYRSKYTVGETDYRFPAKLSDGATKEVQRLAEDSFRILGCRDFARVDFMFDLESRTVYFLEVNTIPGLTTNSLLPRSAACCGLDFIDLVGRLIAPAIRRFGINRVR